MVGKNLKNTLVVLVVVLLAFFIPDIVSAQSDVWSGLSCYQPGQGPCTFCDLVQVTQNVINFLWELALAVGSLLIVIGGIFFIAGGANRNWRKVGKDTFTYAAIGVAIALMGWVIINTAIMLVTDGSLENWNDVQCPDEPYLVGAPDAPAPGGGGGGIVTGVECQQELFDSCTPGPNVPSDECCSTTESELICASEEDGGICKLNNGENCEAAAGGSGINEECASGNCVASGDTYECAPPGDDGPTDPACSDGVDNDGDGYIDYDGGPNGEPADPGCSSPDDDSERGNTACDDGVDNDGDGLTDSNDPGCDDPTDDDELDCTDPVFDIGEDQTIDQDSFGAVFEHRHDAVPVEVDMGTLASYEWEADTDVNCPFGLCNTSESGALTGQSDTTGDFEHHIEGNGEYVVTLTVWTQNGCFASDSVTDFVE